MGKHIVPAVFADWTLAGGSVLAATMRAVNCGSSIVGANILGTRPCATKAFACLPLFGAELCGFGSGK
jgi:hypothetical protein